MCVVKLLWFKRNKSLSVCCWEIISFMVETVTRHRVGYFPVTGTYVKCMCLNIKRKHITTVTALCI